MTQGNALGSRRAVELSQGTIEYWERGDGRPVVFVHGVLVNSALWRGVVPAISDAGFRCIAPDWPLGGHRLAMPGRAVLDPPSVADMIGDFLAALDLHDAILVANDTGGAFVQVAITRHPERIGGVVLTPSDCFEWFFPPTFRYLQVLSHLPAAPYLLAQTLRLSWLHRLPNVFGRVTKRPIPRPVMLSYLKPMREDRGVRRDLGKVLRGVDKRYTLAAAQKFPGFTRPVLLAWAAEDRVFPLMLADRMMQLFPDATLQTIDDSYTFVPEDQPARLAEFIIEFAKS
jgi:pimeloyl-ACP methyl ester carboxylesterase